MNCQEIFNHIPCNVYWLDANGCYLGCNEHYAEFLDTVLTTAFIEKKIVGKNCADFWQHNNISIKDIKKRRLPEQQHYFAMERKYLFADGSIKIFLVHQCPLDLGSDCAQGVIYFEYNVTPFKNRESKLTKILNFFKQQNRQTQQYLDNLVENVPASIYWKDKHSVIRGDNLFHARFAGFNSREEVIGKTDYDFVWRDQAEKLIANDQLVMSTGETQHFEESVSQLDGSEHIVLTSKAPMKTATGEVMGVIGVSVDITDRKRMEKELEAAKKTAELANRAKSEFIENMSHDIKTPITGIIGMTELLILANQDPQVRQYAEEVRNSAEQLLELFSEVLDVMDISSIAEQEKVVFDLKQLGQDVINFLTPSVHNQEVTVNFSMSKQVNRHFYGNRFHVYRTILNLMSNAVKFSNKGGKVSLEIQLLENQKNKQFIEIVVRDTGIGIPEDSHQIIFERYARLASAVYKGKYKGSGLGLYIVKKMVDELGGSIHVDSEEGKGSAFHVRVALEVAKESQKIEKPLVTQHNKIRREQTNPVRVLLIEDNRIAGKTAKLILQTQHCIVDLVANGEDAINKFHLQRYDLVVADIGLPDICGYDVTKSFRTYEQLHNHPGTVIIGLTAHVQKKDLAVGVDVGMNEVFSKPLKLELAQDILQRYFYTEDAASPQTKVKDDVARAIEDKLPIIDMNLGAEIFGGNMHTAEEMMRQLIDMLPEDVKKLHAAYDEGDYSKLSNIAHYIKGGASYCGTPRLKLAATQLDNIIEKNEDSRLVQASYENLCHEIEILLAEYSRQKVAR